MFISCIIFWWTHLLHFNGTNEENFFFCLNSMNSAWSTGCWLDYKVASSSRSAAAARWLLRQACCHRAHRTGCCSTPHGSRALTYGRLILDNVLTALTLPPCAPNLLPQTPNTKWRLLRTKPRRARMGTVPREEFKPHGRVVRGKGRKPSYQTSWTRQPALAASRTNAGKTYGSAPSQSWKWTSSTIWKTSPKPLCRPKEVQLPT